MNTQTVIVTFNRLNLLRLCLEAVSTQRLNNSTHIVNNASSDGTLTFLSELSNKSENIKVKHLKDNIGGAGGFSTGLKLAIESGAEWVWMMDDDAEPHENALEELMKVAKNPNNIYGSLAVNNGETSWLTTVINPPLGEISDVALIPDEAEVQSLPFLGFLIHRNLVERIGLPDTGYFIAADDVEYCVRAQQAGAKIIIAGKSHIEHPKSRPYKVKVLGQTLTCLALPPWKRYYDTRNRLLIAKKYYGIKLITQTIPGSFVRLFSALLKEPNKFSQLYAFSAGFIDGLLGIKGKRHTFWKIKQ